MSKSGTMKTFPLLCTALAFFLAGPLRAEDDIEKAFRDALYAEEVKGDTETALKAYQEVGAKFELQRDMAATALYRQAECLRKLGRKGEAAALYNKVLAQYPDKERTAKLSRENLAALGQPAGPLPAAVAAPAGMTEEEAKELTRLKALAENSPDLLDQPGFATGSPPTPGPTPLDGAAMKGQATVVAWLLKNLKNPTPERLASPLVSACRNGHLKVCELLLEAGASPGRAGSLIAALHNHRLAVARLLLARKADPNQRGAVSASNVSWPLEAGGFKGPVSLQQRRFRTGTPLYAALSEGLPPEIISELIKAGADVDAPVEVSDDAQQSNESAAAYPVTPLGAAILKGDTKSVRLLLEAKADPNRPCNDLEATPLLVSLAMSEAYKANLNGDAIVDDIAGQLVAAGADWKARLSTGATALHIAARRGAVRWIDEALKAGLDVNTSDINGYTALHFAAEKGPVECVQKLLAASAKVDAVTTDDWKITPLGVACRYLERNDTNLARNDANLKILKALLNAKADPNALYARGDTLLNLVLPAGNPDWCWPEAAVELTEWGARVGRAQPEFFSSGTFRLQPGNTPGPGIPSQAKVSPERLLTAFRVLWKATHWRDNPRLPNAVWLDDGETPVREGGKPVFSPQFCDDSALSAPPSLRVFFSKAWWLLDAHPNIRRDFTRVTVRRMKDGKEEVIPVDLLALATKTKTETPPVQQKIVPAGTALPGDGNDFPLQWGDVVSIPRTENPDLAPSYLVQKWCYEATTIKVRLELAGGGVVTNAAAGGEALWISTVAYTGGYPSIAPAALLREAGIPATLLNLTIKQKHMSEAGVMETLPSLERCQLGDILTLEPPAPHGKISEDALRSGIWLCQSMDGPFWPVPGAQYVDEKPAPLGGLLVALMAPHPLPFTNVAWDKAVVRSLDPPGNPDPFAEPAPKKWVEQKLMDAWPQLKLVPGTVLILPSAGQEIAGPPAALRERLTRALSFDWLLAIGQQPEATSHYAPRFFKRSAAGSSWHWQDADLAAAGNALLPVATDLLAAHPRAAEYLPTSSPWWPTDQWPVVLKGLPGVNELGKLNAGAPEWLPPGAKISVTPAPKPGPSQAPSARAPGAPRQRIVLPSQGQ